MNQRKASEDPQNALLGDLESIRSLLDDDDEAPRAEDDALRSKEPEVEDLEVPVLEDVVDDQKTEDVGGDSGAESDSRTESAPTGEGSGSAPRLDDDLFRALLSDAWRDSAGEILKQAREVIDEHSAQWSPSETDTLNDALKVRIDATIQGWMRGMVVTHMADLHELLLKELSAELKATIDTIIKQRNIERGNETTDGQ